MPRERIVDAQPAMSDGLNDVSDDLALLPTQLRVAINARLTEYGAVTKRGGTQRAHTTALGGAIANGFSWRQDATGTQEILAVANGTLHTTAYGTFPWTWTTESGSLSTAEAPTFAQFRDGTDDVVYIADGGLLNKWDGSTLTVDIAGTIGARMITVHNQRLWSCGCGVAPDSIFYSALNDGDTLGNAGAGGGEIIVRTFGDENVVALASIGTSLLIFHRRGVSRLTGYGQDDITVEPQGITADVGLIAAKSVVTVGNVGFFLSERGLYRCNEAEVAPVGTVEKPDPLLARIRQLSTAQFGSIRAEFNRATRELWISIPGVGVYTYHTILQSWSGPWDTGYVSPATTALFGVLDANGLPVLVRGDADGFVSLCDAPVALDNVLANGTGGTRYSMVVQLHRLYAGDDALAKSLRWGYITARLNGSDACSIAWKTETDALSFTLPVSLSSLWGTGTWTGSTLWGGPSSQNYRIPMGGTGYYTDVQIIDTGSQLPVFSRFQLEAFAMGRR
jgi:hypothetical protein